MSKMGYYSLLLCLALSLLIDGTKGRVLPEEQSAQNNSINDGNSMTDVPSETQQDAEVNDTIVDSPSDNEEDIPDPSYFLDAVHIATPDEIQIDRLSRFILGLNYELLSFAPRDASGRHLNFHDRMVELQRLPQHQVITMLRDQGVHLPEQKRPICDQNSLFYRTMDGSCNNQNHHCWGKTGEPYRRWLAPSYSDGIGLPRVRRDGGPLPNPRNVYLWVSSQKDETSETAHHLVSSLAVVWGQMIAHDLVLTPTVTFKSLQKGRFIDSAPSCCDPRFSSNPECAAVVLEEEDGFYRKGHCMDIPRSAASAFGSDSCSRLQLGRPREQMNQLTAFLDASVVYGSSEAKARELRENNGTGAKLTMSNIHDWQHWTYPPRQNSTASCKSHHTFCDKRCFSVGERRANENPILGALHTLWAREHNRLVDKFRLLAPGWSEDTLFHVVRKIISAMMQHITYKEYIPELFGVRLAEWMKLSVPTHNYVYNPNLNPTIYNVFAASAFRYGHSQVSTRYQRHGMNYTSSPFLSNDFFSMDDYCGPSHNEPMTVLLEGQLNQPAQLVDNIFSKQITNHLFAKQVNGSGLDLFSINVQRGRDHGLPPYTAWRKACGMPPVNSYKDLSDTLPPEVIDRLERVYGPDGVHEIDLYVAGVSETPVNGGILGKTFTCIISNQFINLKYGDRFWYENPFSSNHPGGFHPPQIKSIQKTTLAGLLCRNAGIAFVQERALEIHSEHNPKKSCAHIMADTDIDIRLWTG